MDISILERCKVRHQEYQSMTQLWVRNLPFSTVLYPITVTKSLVLLRTVSDLHLDPVDIPEIAPRDFLVHHSSKFTGLTASTYGI